MAISGFLLIFIDGYSINGYCWLLYCKPLVGNLLVVIDGSSIDGY
jgi:hypothetical protein